MGLGQIVSEMINCMVVTERKRFTFKIKSKINRLVGKEKILLILVIKNQETAPFSLRIHNTAFLLYLTPWNRPPG